MYVFQIGFNRCGTQSIYHFFRRNGLACAHWQRGQLARTIYSNLTDGRPLLDGLDEFEIFTDMEWLTKDFFFEAYKLFPLLYLDHPDAIFILNTRSREKWIASRTAHGQGDYIARAKQALRLDTEAEVHEYWRNDWDHHHERVRTFFAENAARFFEFNIEEHDGAYLASMMPEMALNPKMYSHRGATKEAPA